MAEQEGVPTTGDLPVGPDASFDPIEQLQHYATKTRQYMQALTALVCLTTLTLFFLALTLRDEFDGTRNGIIFLAALLAFASVFSYLLQQNAVVALLTMMRSALGYQNLAGDMTQLHKSQFQDNRVMRARMQAGMMADTMSRMQPQYVPR